MPLKFQAGDKFPECTFTDENGQAVALGDVLAKGPLFLAFYRGYW